MAAKKPSPAGRAKPRRCAPRLPREERRDQLLDAVLSPIAKQGYESVSMEGIARRAGVTKPVVRCKRERLTAFTASLLEGVG